MIIMAATTTTITIIIIFKTVIVIIGVWRQPLSALIRSDNRCPLLSGHLSDLERFSSLGQFLLLFVSYSSCSVCSISSNTPCSPQSTALLTRKQLQDFHFATLTYYVFIMLLKMTLHNFRTHGPYVYHTLIAVVGLHNYLSSCFSIVHHSDQCRKMSCIVTTCIIVKLIFS